MAPKPTPKNPKDKTLVAASAAKSSSSVVAASKTAAMSAAPSLQTSARDREEARIDRDFTNAYHLLLATKNDIVEETDPKGLKHLFGQFGTQLVRLFICRDLCFTDERLGGDERCSWSDVPI